MNDNAAIEDTNRRFREKFHGVFKKQETQGLLVAPVENAVLSPDTQEALKTAAEWSGDVQTVLPPKMQKVILDSVGGKRSIAILGHYRKDEAGRFGKPDGGWMSFNQKGQLTANESANALAFNESASNATQFEAYRRPVESVVLALEKGQNSRLIYFLRSPTIRVEKANGRPGGGITVQISLPANTAKELHQQFQDNPAQARIFFLSLMSDVPAAHPLWNKETLPQRVPSYEEIDQKDGRIYFIETFGKNREQYTVTGLQRDGQGWKKAVVNPQNFHGQIDQKVTPELIEKIEAKWKRNTVPINPNEGKSLFKRIFGS